MASGTDILLAGTGDPNDALDSYYGEGILRSADGGNTWTLAQQSNWTRRSCESFVRRPRRRRICVEQLDARSGGCGPLAVGGGHSGECAETRPTASWASTTRQDAGVTWQMGTIEDGTGQYVQRAATAIYPGNAATAVVWNPVRQMFYAAVRYHGYYQSPDGILWTRLANQPGTGLTMTACPTNPNGVGSTTCPIFRGALAVQPATGDTFALTVDSNNLDQGLVSGCVRAHRIELRYHPDRIQQEADLDSAGGRQRIDGNPAGGLQPLAGSRGDRDRRVRRHAALCRNGGPLSLLARRRMRAAQHHQRNQWMQCPGDGLPGAARDCHAGGSGNGWHAAAALCRATTAASGARSMA